MAGQRRRFKRDLWQEHLVESIGVELSDDYHNLIDTKRVSSTVSRQLHGTIEVMAKSIRASYYRENFHIDHRHNQQIKDKSTLKLFQHQFNQNLQQINNRKIKQQMPQINHQNHLRLNKHHLLNRSDIQINMKMNHHHIDND